ncbi:MAG TPA: hypothetical protein VFJ98_05065, partial [Mycobacteriales bacterium]|nr:hypothetical protein [Mycobacteriales bacterium]
HLVPGAAVVLAGLMLIVAAGRLATNRLACLLALAGGAWLVLGPLFASMWLGADAAETTIASSTLDQVARPLGYHYGTGLLIVAFAAYALGRRLVVGSYGPYPSDDRLATRGAAVTDDTPAAHVTPTD